jgi:hypothetical protein
MKLKPAAPAADGCHVNAAALPFTSFDVLYTLGVGVLLLVAAVVARLRISRGRPVAVRQAEPVSTAMQDQPQAQAAQARLPA